MSRIGKIPVTIPDGVTATVDGNTVTIKGTKGELTRTFSPLVKIEQKEQEIVVTPTNEERDANAQWGLTRTLISNMVEGVTQGYTKNLELVGVGYRVALKGKDLDLSLGYSHPVLYKAPEGITFQCPDNTHITVSGYSKELVGQVAAEIRAKRPPEPYKGKGIRYESEHVRRKLGKAAK